MPTRRHYLACAILLLFARASTPASQSPPPIVESGRRPAVGACGDCHPVNGAGRPGMSTLAGLPREYIAHQIADFQKRFRTSSDARLRAMVYVSAALTEDEIAEASEFYASIKPTPWIRVVEAGAKARRNERIYEVADGKTYVAYVPAGSLARGERLVNAGASGRTVRCANCHGDELRGTASVPGIAGRSPSYLARQLNDMRSRSRHGSGSDRMMGTIARIDDDDVVAMAAYLASMAP